MEKYISYEKMSKKQQKLVKASKRGSWGNVKPITKVRKYIIVKSRIPKAVAIASGAAFLGVLRRLKGVALADSCRC